MKGNRWLIFGIVIFLGSVLIGILGTIQGILSSFVALDQAENVGIGAVSSGIESALLFTVISLIGSLFGIALVAIGGVKAYRHSKRTASALTD